MSTPKDIAAPYMQHKPECSKGKLDGVNYDLRRGTVCDCGLDQALEALSKIPPALSVVEAGNAMRRAVGDLTIVENAMEDDDGTYGLDDPNNAWLRLAQAAESWDASLSQGEAAPHAGALLGKWEDLLIQLGNKERALPGEVDDFGDALRDYLARSVGLKRQGEAVQKDGGLVVTREMFEHDDGAPASQSLAVPLSAVSIPSVGDAAAIGGATLSRDYDHLYQHLCDGGEALGIRTSNKTGAEKRAPILLRLCADGEFDFQQGWEQTGKQYSKSQFIAECTRLSLEWVAPANASAAFIPEKPVKAMLDLNRGLIRLNDPHTTECARQISEYIERLEAKANA